MSLASHYSPPSGFFVLNDPSTSPIHTLSLHDALPIFFCLDPVICPCSTMYRIHPGYLAWVLESLLEGEVINRISVGQDVAEPARLALERMLAVKPAAPGPAAGRGGWRPSCTPTCSWSDPGSPD